MEEAGDSADAGAAEGDDPLLVALGSRIRQARDDAGLSFGGLASAAGVSRGYVFRLETGKQNASIRSLAKIAVALSTTLSELLSGVDAGEAMVGKRKYVWRGGSDPRDPDRPLGNRRTHATRSSSAILDSGDPEAEDPSKR